MSHNASEQSAASHQVNSEETRSIVEAVLEGSISPNFGHLKQLALVSKSKKQDDQAATLLSIVLASGTNALSEGEFVLWRSLMVSLGALDLAARILDRLHERDPDFHWNIWKRHPGTPEDESRRAWFDRRQEHMIAEEMPSVFLNTMHKSGSMTLVQTFIEMFDLPTCRISFDSALIDLVVPAWAKHFARGGALTQEHIPATKENIDTLVDAGVRKMVVHMRRPEQAILSSLYYAEKIARQHQDTPIDFWGWGSNPPSEENRASRLDALLEKDLPRRAQWVGEWARVRDERDDIDVLITTYENLVSDPTQTIADMVRFFGLPMRKNLIDLGQYKSDRTHFRSGRTDEWREHLDTSQIERARKTLQKHIPPAFMDELGWAA